MKNGDLAETTSGQVEPSGKNSGEWLEQSGDCAFIAMSFGVPAAAAIDKDRE